MRHLRITLDTQSNVLPSFFRGCKMTIEKELQNQVKTEIGDDENLTFKEKAILAQKFGVTPAFYTARELMYWEMREQEGVADGR